MPTELGFTSLDASLRFAISHRRLLAVVYHGHQRVAEPHDYGLQSGRERLLVYQLRANGAAAGKSTRGWRLLDVSEITACDVLDQTFAGSRGAEHDTHDVWDAIYARVGVRRP